MAEIGKDIEKAKHLLEQNELIGIPTETVYGLAGNAFSGEACTKIFEVKNRPSFDPLITHTDSIEKIKQYVADFPPKARQLAEAFWPGPLTLLLPKKEVVPDIVTSGLDRVAVRIPDHPLTLSLLATLDFPLAAPSANPFGYISPTKAIHVDEQLGDKIPYVLDGGDCKIGIESTIIGFDDDEVVVYRLGGMSVEQIEEVVGTVTVRPHSTSNPAAPGMLKSHYAPTKPVIIGNIGDLLTKYDPKEVAILSFCDMFPAVAESHQVSLSETRDLSEAAQRLFSALRELDKLDVKVILSEYVPDQGLGRAINDRLRRAAAQEE
jgi:L-threonylcarbamoyladenylate synthase